MNHRDDPTRNVTLKLSWAPEMAGILDGLSADIRKSEAEAIVQAIVLLRVAVDAVKQGKRLAITDEDLNVEREILIPGRNPEDA